MEKNINNEIEPIVIEIENMTPEDEENEELLDNVFDALRDADEEGMIPKISSNGIELTITYGNVDFVTECVSFNDEEDDPFDDEDDEFYDEGDGFHSIEEFVDGILSLLSDKFRFEASDSFRSNLVNAMKEFEGITERG